MPKAAHTCGACLHAHLAPSSDCDQQQPPPLPSGCILFQQQAMPRQCRAGLQAPAAAQQAPAGQHHLPGQQQVRQAPLAVPVWCGSCSAAHPTAADQVRGADGLGYRHISNHRLLRFTSCLLACLNDPLPALPPAATLQSMRAAARAAPQGMACPSHRLPTEPPQAPHPQGPTQQLPQPRDVHAPAQHSTQTQQRR